MKREQWGVRCQWWDDEPDIDCEEPADIDCKYCRGHQAQADVVNKFLWSAFA